MSERALFETVAAEEGWHERTQIDVLLQYIVNQRSDAAFEDSIAQMRDDALDDAYADDPDEAQDATLVSSPSAETGHSCLNST